jgi:hypothetical protein
LLLRNRDRASDTAEAERRCQGWIDKALASGVSALQRFAERLRPYLHGIIPRTCAMNLF